MADRYCKPSDLLVGDVTVSPAKASQFINAAADEIDGELGAEYVVPFDTVSAPAHVVLTLQRICALIASGRYFLAQAGSEELHLYGKSLLKEGQGKLAMIRTGETPLVGVSRQPRLVEGNAPETTPGDAISPLDAYYSSTGRTSDFWSPG